MNRFDEIIISNGWLNDKELGEYRKSSLKRGVSLLKMLVLESLVEEEQVLRALAGSMSVDFYPSLSVPAAVDPKAVQKMPVKLAQHYQVIPVEYDNSSLTVAVSDPTSSWVIEDLELNLGVRIKLVLACAREISNAITRHYGLGTDTIDDILADGEVNISVQELPEDVDTGADDASVIKLVNQIINEAVRQRATDIHIEPYRNSLVIKQRIDGVLYDMNVSEEAKHLRGAIVSRIKIISGLDVVQKRKPQDGRVLIKTGTVQADLRVSVIPSIYGESVVIRILPSGVLMGLDDLGFYAEHQEIIEKSLQSSTGIIFVTGPTGSGKTTTLYACLQRLDRDKKKIITLEDPVEYELQGITQIQIRANQGFGFSDALRSVLRHDPDIMMVGEVRDSQTAQLAVRTALTGHLILSTMHTNDAVSSAVRLMDLGIEPYLLASSIRAFIAQRLVRCLCDECKVKTEDGYGAGAGCVKCSDTGYHGRTALYEILTVDENIMNMITEKKSADQIRQAASVHGYVSFSDTAGKKVEQGLISRQEVIRVLGI